jgi:hypothetical protein
MIAGFSICESLQMLALMPTRVKPARRSGGKGSQISSPSTPRLESSISFSPERLICQRNAMLAIPNLRQSRWPGFGVHDGPENALPRFAALGLLPQSIKWPVPLISFPCRNELRAYRINKELIRLLARLNSALLLSCLQLLNHNQQLRLNLLNSALRDVFY